MENDIYECRKGKWYTSRGGVVSYDLIWLGKPELLPPGSYLWLQANGLKSCYAGFFCEGKVPLPGSQHLLPLCFRGWAFTERENSGLVPPRGPVGSKDL